MNDEKRAADLLEHLPIGHLAAYMDDDIREDLHSELAVSAPTVAQNVEFLARYMEAHLEKFGEEWVIN